MYRGAAGSVLILRFPARNLFGLLLTSGDILHPLLEHDDVVLQCVEQSIRDAVRKFGKGAFAFDMTFLIGGEVAVAWGHPQPAVGCLFGIVQASNCDDPHRSRTTAAPLEPFRDHRQPAPSRAPLTGPRAARWRCRRT